MTSPDSEISPRLQKALDSWLEKAKTMDSNVSTIIRADGKVWSMQWVKGRLIPTLIKKR